MGDGSMHWLRGALTDDRGQWDVAFIALFAVGLAVFLTIPFICLLSAAAYFRCVPYVREGAVVAACVFDPQPLGIAIGAVCGGFATSIGALAAYMAATRRPLPTLV